MVSIDSSFVPGQSVMAWVDGRLAVPGLAPGLRGALEGLREEAERAASRPCKFFLSVVIRTQGTRWEQLKDALLCLSAQTDQGFHLLIMMHDVADGFEARLRELIVSYPGNFADRITILDVRGGGRSRPLSASLEHLAGEYVAFYDDDDLLMADWVETFRKASEVALGSVIRACVAVQENEPEKWTNGAHGQRSVGPALAPYPQSFRFFEHLDRSYSPFMGLAYPVAFFSEWGETFDETLPVCEDWDLLMRASSLMGVHSVDSLTAIYRLWRRTATSYTSHQESEWDDAKEKLQKKLNRFPVLLPADAVSNAVETLNEGTEETRILRESLDSVERVRREMVSSTSWRMTSVLRKITGALRGN